MGIAHYFVDVAKAFEELIIERFRESYAAGETPNPCVDCNTLLKFSLVWDLIAEAFGIRHVATGHYGRVVETEGGPRLGRGKDKSKDQSYFLYGIAAERLGRFVLPLGEYTKVQVREIAEKLGLSVAQKPESMELCFAGEADYRNALDDAQSNRPGDLTDMAGERIGEHKGISNYTLGQRRGLGFAGGEPLYVGRIDAGTNTVALGTRDQVSRRVIRAGDTNVLIAEGLCKDALLYGKIRSYGDPRPCRVAAVSESGITVEFDEPQFAPSSGQKLVLYDDSDYVVVGGTITGDRRDEAQ
jgi:tRNA-specific 2-thiouridylase